MAQLIDFFIDSLYFKGAKFSTNGIFRNRTVLLNALNKGCYDSMFIHQKLHDLSKYGYK